mgnify:CR=1 FL=1
MTFNFETDSKGYVKKRESFDLEYKQNFQLGDGLLKFIRTLVGMANNKGGMIVFGIKDAPHVLLGMTNDKLQETDPKEIDKRIREYFSPEIHWKSEIVERDGKKYGFLYVDESEEKPIVCKKANEKASLREGAIYYRYRAETKEIEYPELKKLLDKEKEKERILWIKHIEKISMVGPRNAHIFDSYKGELSYGDSKILIDKNLLNQISFIREGHFTDKEGEGMPTLKLVGNVEGIDMDNVVTADPNITHPLFTKNLQTELGVNSYEIKAIIYSLDLKNKPKRHIEIANGAKNVIHKYSQSAVDAIQRLFERDGKDNVIRMAVEGYKKAHPNKGRKKKNK